MIDERGNRGQWLLYSVLILLACGLSFAFGRLFERNYAKQPQPSPRAATVSEVAAPEVNAQKPALRTDDEIGSEIVALYSELTPLNWELVTPLKEFEAGKIDRETLRRQTTEPELKALRICTRMQELANGMKSQQTRTLTIALTSALLQRHRGLTLIIEGYVTSDDAKVIAGSQLFEKGRNESIQRAAELGNPNRSETKLLDALHDAYESDPQRTRSADQNGCNTTATLEFCRYQRSFAECA